MVPHLKFEHVGVGTADFERRHLCQRLAVSRPVQVEQDEREASLRRTLLQQLKRLLVG